MHAQSAALAPMTPKKLGTLALWIALGAAVGAASGVASAAFLVLLERATRFRENHEQIVYALPVAAVAVGLVYERWGKSIKGGTSLVLDTIHDGGPPVPLRMTPMVLVGTVLTHLFGGSAGREGTAVQMGASLADAIAHRARATPDLRRRLLVAGAAGGFGSVFGTPVAGAIFGLEFTAIGGFEGDAIVPAVVASVTGDVVTRALGVVHTAYPPAPFVALTPLLAAKWLVFAVAMALAATAFLELVHAIKATSARMTSKSWLRMAAGGALVVAGWKLVGTSDYLGLGVPTIVRAFTDASIPPYAFALKLAFTAVTIGVGFLGGEVTPLFFVGATLGSALARLVDVPIALGAGVGLAAVFGAAANTPLALSIMVVEVLGPNVLPHALIVTALAYVLTGRRSLYASQRVRRGKLGEAPAREGAKVSDPEPK